jgi:hypothetical protein
VTEYAQPAQDRRAAKQLVRSAEAHVDGDVTVVDLPEIANVKASALVSLMNESEGALGREGMNRVVDERSFFFLGGDHLTSVGLALLGKTSAHYRRFDGFTSADDRKDPPAVPGPVDRRAFIKFGV